MAEYNIEYINMNDFTNNNNVISCLEKGDVKGARSLLGRYYGISGTVIKGEGLGSKIGFPTANLVTDERLPAPGVYAAFCTIDGKTHRCMVNIGTRPTVSDARKLSVEVHIFELNENLYGKYMTVSFVERLRSEYKFESTKALSGQLTRDKQAALHILSKY